MKDINSYSKYLWQIPRHLIFMGDGYEWGIQWKKENNLICPDNKNSSTKYHFVVILVLSYTEPQQGIKSNKCLASIFLVIKYKDVYFIITDSYTYAGFEFCNHRENIILEKVHWWTQP